MEFLFQIDYRRDIATVVKNPTPRFCSRSCSNARVQTEKANKARQQKLLRHKCLICGNKISKQNKNKICGVCKPKILEIKGKGTPSGDGDSFEKSCTVKSWLAGSTPVPSVLNNIYNNEIIKIYDDGTGISGSLLKKIHKYLLNEEKTTIIIKEFSGNFKKAIKYILLKRGNYKCSIRKCKNVHNNKKLVFILDHIDGNPYNNFIGNLRLICPNCDSQLDTYKSKNRGHGRISNRNYMRNMAKLIKK